MDAADVPANIHAGPREARKQILADKAADGGKGNALSRLTSWREASQPAAAQSPRPTPARSRARARQSSAAALRARLPKQACSGLRFAHDNQLRVRICSLSVAVYCQMRRENNFSADQQTASQRCPARSETAAGRSANQPRSAPPRILVLEGSLPALPLFSRRSHRRRLRFRR